MYHKDQVRRTMVKCRYVVRLLSLRKGPFWGGCLVCLGEASSDAEESVLLGEASCLCEEGQAVFGSLFCFGLVD